MLELVVVVKLVVVEPSDELVEDEVVVGMTAVVVVAGSVVVHCPPQSSETGRPTARARMRRASLAVMRQSASTSQRLVGHALKRTATRNVNSASDAVGGLCELTGAPQTTAAGA